MAETVLVLTNLTKQFGDFMAVDHISFAIKEGEIVGLLGPNGAGKTTTIQMLLGLLTPTSGTISYFGRDFAAHQVYCLSKINYTSAYAHLQNRMTVRQNFRVYGGLYGVAAWEKRVQTLAELLGIADKLDQLYWHLSSGEKTRVHLVKALINRPKLILMDEPTASLDPDIVSKFIDFISELQKREKVAILYTSHNMSEVSRLCDRVVFLDHGKILAVDTPLGLTKRIKQAAVIITFDGPAKTVTSYLEDKGFAYTFLRPTMVEVKAPEELLAKILFGLGERKIWITDIDVRKPDLEDVFLTIASGRTYEFKKS